MKKPFYNQRNKDNSRVLRNNQTDAERLLWSRLRRKQVCGVQFYRQKPLGNYIVDFYGPSVGLVIEVDGGQHFDEDYLERDKRRDAYLRGMGLRVLRFDNLQVLKSIGEVVGVIYEEVLGAAKSPRLALLADPLLERG